MTPLTSISAIGSNAIEIHYWLEDNTHLMDAIVQNKCESEILGIIKEIANAFQVELQIETSPFAEGGLKRFFKIASKEERKKATITSAIITALLTSVIITPIATSITKIAEKLIENIFEDPEVKELEKEKLRLEVEKLRQETNANTYKIDASNVIAKRKSNFYEVLDKYPKVTEVTFTISNEMKTSAIEERTVIRSNFKDYILITDELEPVIIDDVVIEIISPVLKKGKYKWMGIYDSEPVPFSVKSKEFKELVQSGKVQFKNGTSINCQLTIKKKINNEGIEKITSIEVNRVNSYFENDKSIETPEGRKHRKQKEADELQLKLFNPDEDLKK